MMMMMMMMMIMVMAVVTWRHESCRVLRLVLSLLSAVAGAAPLQRVCRVSAGLALHLRGHLERACN
jgi:hypothetical protein